MLSKMKTLALLAICLSVISMPVSVFAAESAWGSMAVDSEDNSAQPIYGIGGGANEQEAVDSALSFCKEAGGKSCVKVFTYQGCGAFASAGDAKGNWAQASTRKQAQLEALNSCESDQCAIVASDCN